MKKMLVRVQSEFLTEQFISVGTSFYFHELEGKEPVEVLRNHYHIPKLVVSATSVRDAGHPVGKLPFEKALEEVDGFDLGSGLYAFKLTVECNQVYPETLSMIKTITGKTAYSFYRERFYEYMTRKAYVVKLHPLEGVYYLYNPKRKKFLPYATV